MIPEFRLFGGAALIAPDGHLVSGGAAQPRRLAVLAVLADAWPSTVTRDRVVGLLWPDHDEAGARRLLTQALYALRQELGDFTRGSGRDLGIDPDALRVDLIEFRRAQAGGFPEAAAALYRGPVLDGFHLRGALEFERWVEQLREDSRRQLQKAVEEIIGVCTSEGRARDAARWAERLVQTAPYDAAATLHLMALWEHAGDPGAAFAAAAAYARRMREELGLEPDPAVGRRADELRASGAALRVSGGMPLAASAVVARPSGETRAVPEDETDDPPVAAGGAFVGAAAPPVPGVPLAEGEPAGAAEPRPDAGSRTARRPRARWLVVAAAALATAAIVPAYLAQGGRAVVTPPPRVVRVLPFEVHGERDSSSALAKAVATMLVANLDGSGGVRVEEAGAGPATGAPRGELRGIMVMTGGQLRLDGDLRLAEGAAPVKVSVAGPRDSLLPLVERLSVQLMPAFHPGLATAVDWSALRRVTRAATLRRRLEGEAALRRGAFDEGYLAFRAATELDSADAMGWYRRAVAAELAHRNGEADRAIAAAMARRATLPARDRALLEGYARWRAGDATGADSTFRRLLANDSQHREAWLQLAEVAYHAGPLRGQSPDAARDLWARVIELDPGNVHGLVHAVRLEARAGNLVAIAPLLQRLREGGATGSALVESEVIAAYGTRDPARIAAVAPVLDTLPDYSLDFVQGVVAGLLEQPDAAAPIARRLTARGRPDAVRARGHLALAHIALAGGRRREAWEELALAERLSPVAAAWTRAYFATLPFVATTDSLRAAAAQALAGVPTRADAPLYLQVAVDASAAPVIERYLAALLAPPGSPEPAALSECRAPEWSSCELCEDLRRGLRAERAFVAGRAGEALAELEGQRMTVPYQYAGRSAFFARTRERYRRAELLERVGRTREAEAWYEAVPHGARVDYIWLAPTHLARARLRERRGDSTGAATHYRKAIDLWRTADADMAHVRQEAEEGLRRLGVPR